MKNQAILKSIKTAFNQSEDMEYTDLKKLESLILDDELHTSTLLDDLHHYQRDVEHTRQAYKYEPDYSYSGSILKQVKEILKQVKNMPDNFEVPTLPKLRKDDRVEIWESSPYGNEARAQHRFRNAIFRDLIEDPREFTHGCYTKADQNLLMRIRKQNEYGRYLVNQIGYCGVVATQDKKPYRSLLELLPTVSKARRATTLAERAIEKLTEQKFAVEAEVRLLMKVDELEAIDSGIAEQEAIIKKYTPPPPPPAS